MSLIHMLRNARHELICLRRENELLRGQVRVIDIIGACVLGVPQRGGMSHDVVFDMDHAIHDLEAAPPEGPGS